MLASENDITRWLFEQTDLPPDQVYVEIERMIPVEFGCSHRWNTEINAFIRTSDIISFDAFVNIDSFDVNGLRVFIEHVSIITGGWGGYYKVKFSLHIIDLDIDALRWRPFGEPGFIDRIFNEDIRRTNTVSLEDDPDSETYHDNMPGMTIDEFQKWTDELIAEFGKEIDTSE
jgi:hypothetical protein